MRNALALTAMVIGVIPLARGDVAIVATLPGTYTDISATGTLIPLGDDDSAVVSAAFGNPIFPVGDIVISNNGGIGFGPFPSTLLAPENQPIPSSDAFGGAQAVLPYWDDIGDTIGGVYYQALTDRYIVQWTGKPIARGDTVTFQVQIFNSPVGSPPIYAQFLYADVQSPAAGGGASATIGYQTGPAPFNDVQWSFDQPGAVADGGVLSLIPEPASLLLLAVATSILRRR